MKKKYMVWWHSYVNEISRDAATIEEVSNSVSKTLESLNKLKNLEKEGKIKVKEVGGLNPLYIEILDKSVEEEIAKNPIVDIEET
jgi:hypothetical protein